MAVVCGHARTCRRTSGLGVFTRVGIRSVVGWWCRKWCSECKKLSRSMRNVCGRCSLFRDYRTDLSVKRLWLCIMVMFMVLCYFPWHLNRTPALLQDTSSMFTLYGLPLVHVFNRCSTGYVINTATDWYVYVTCCSLSADLNYINTPTKQPP